MTNSLHVITDEKVQLNNKLQDYGKMIKALTAENTEMKATNEKYKVALENVNKQKQNILQMNEEKSQNDMNQILRLEAENQALKDELNIIRNNVLIHEPDEKSHDDNSRSGSHHTDSSKESPNPVINHGPTPRWAYIGSKSRSQTPRYPSSTSIVHSHMKTPMHVSFNENKDCKEDDETIINHRNDASDDAAYQLLVGIPNPKNLHKNNTLSPAWSPGSDNAFNHRGGDSMISMNSYTNAYSVVVGQKSPPTGFTEKIGHETVDLYGHGHGQRDSRDTYPYIDEEDDDEHDEIVLDENEKKLSDVIKEYTTKTEALENELSDCYTEIEQLKIKVQQLMNEREMNKHEKQMWDVTREDSKLEVTSDPDIKSDGDKEEVTEIRKEEESRLALLFTSFFLKP